VTIFGVARRSLPPLLPPARWWRRPRQHASCPSAFAQSASRAALSRVRSAAAAAAAAASASAAAAAATACPTWLGRRRRRPHPRPAPLPAPLTRRRRHCRRRRPSQACDFSARCRQLLVPLRPLLPLLLLLLPLVLPPRGVPHAPTGGRAWPLRRGEGPPTIQLPPSSTCQDHRGRLPPDAPPRRPLRERPLRVHRFLHLHSHRVRRCARRWCVRCELANMLCQVLDGGSWIVA